MSLPRLGLAGDGKELLDGRSFEPMRRSLVPNRRFVWGFGCPAVGEGTGLTHWTIRPAYRVLAGPLAGGDRRPPPRPRLGPLEVGPPARRHDQGRAGGGVARHLPTG